jgi:peptide/nickel transport system substrate-binding protein
MKHRTSVIRAIAAIAAIGTMAAMAGCSSTSKSSSVPNTITIGLNAAPSSLDPAKGSNTPEGIAYVDLTYSPLINLNGDGALSPGLATSWKYTDSALTTFQLTLRSGVKFSDGKPLTAESVVKSIERAQTAGGSVVPTYAAVIKTADATSTHTVTLHLMQPDPTIAQVLTQRFLVGSIVGPDGLADPASLGTSTDGAGPYMLDKAATVANDHYTFVPNPYYWDKKSVHFKKFTVRVIPNPQTAYNAVKSGQIAFVDGSPSTVGQAASNKALDVYSVPAAWYGLDLFDRGGAVVPALSKQKVREALNYAIDRKAITTSLFGKYGVPTSEISDEAYSDNGFDPAYQNHYSYDPAKAKKLLAEAGYPSGFSLTIGAIATYGDGVEVSQAIASDWAKIGVTAKIDTGSGTSGIIAPLLAKQLPVFAMYYDAQPMYLESSQLLDQKAGLFNIFGSVDPQLTSLLTKARAQTSKAAAVKAWAAVERRVVDLGWFVPVAVGPEQFYAAKGLSGVDISAAASSPDPTRLHY